MDAYGLEKLTCENILKKHWKDKHNYFILRLPDVIGPYDDSARLWVIVLRMQALFKNIQNKEAKERFETLRFEFDSEEEKNDLSVVSSIDVSNILNSILLSSPGK